MRKASVTSLHHLGVLFLLLCRDLSYLVGELGRRDRFVYETRALSSSPQCLCAPHLHSSSWDQYCLWQALGTSGIGLVGNRNLVKQSGLSCKVLFLNCSNCHGNFHKITTHASGEPFAMNLLRAMPCSDSKVILGLCWGFSVAKGFPYTACWLGTLLQHKLLLNQVGCVIYYLLEKPCVFQLVPTELRYMLVIFFPGF